MTTQIMFYHTQAPISNLGPGKRYGIWVQGCSFACEGCLVEDSWKIDVGKSKNITELCNEILMTKDIEGLTISGGEPFEQIDALYTLIKEIKSSQNKLSIVIFTGFTLKELKKRDNYKILYIIQQTDILVDGKYIKELYRVDPWRGSTNQIIHFLTRRYSIQDYKEAYTKHTLEYYIKDGQGKYFTSGIPIKKDEK